MRNVSATGLTRLTRGRKHMLRRALSEIRHEARRTTHGAKGLVARAGSSDRSRASRCRPSPALPTRSMPVGAAHPRGGRSYASAFGLLPGNVSGRGSTRFRNRFRDSPGPGAQHSTGVGHAHVRARRTVAARAAASRLAAAAAGIPALSGGGLHRLRSRAFTADTSGLCIDTRGASAARGVWSRAAGPARDQESRSPHQRGKQ